MALQYISDSPQSEAVSMIEDFHTQFGDAHYAFACHAAFPISLTPRLLYTLRDYYLFRPDREDRLPFPWEAVSDLLLSPLCRHVRGDSYEMEPRVRQILLEELQEDELMGDTLIHSLSDFLQDEIHQMEESQNPNDRVWAQNQSWSIRVYREPQEVLREMAARLPDSEEKLQRDRSYLQIRQIADIIKIQAGESREAFEKLHLLTDRMASYASGQTQKLGRQSLNRLLDDDGRLVLGGIELFVPARDIPQVEDPGQFQAEMGYELARERIRQAMESQSKELHLDRLKLNRIPPEIEKLSWLEVLDLSHNELGHLPVELRTLFSLQSLDLSSNKLGERETETLDFGPFGNLQSLDISENSFKSIEQLFFEPQGNQLMILNLNGNQLEDLPFEMVVGFQTFSELRQLHIERNNFKEIPNVLADIENLEFLDISHNQIEEIPPSIAQLSKLQTLDLGYNRIRELPAELLELPLLIHIDLIGNPIEYPPKAIWKQGLGPIRKYLKTEGRPTAPPVVFLAFAQTERSNAPLLSLEDEKKNIERGLQAAISQGLCELVSRNVSSFEEIEKVFIDRNYQNRIAIFHYAGNINPSALFLEEEDVSRSRVISLLGAQKHLQFVFLNSDSTQDWAWELNGAGIPYVVATKQAIQDELATQFATKFYQYLGYDIGIKQALEKANAAIEEKFLNLNPEWR